MRSSKRRGRCGREQRRSHSTYAGRGCGAFPPLYSVAMPPDGRGGGGPPVGGLHGWSLASQGTLQSYSGVDILRNYLGVPLNSSSG